MQKMFRKSGIAVQVKATKESELRLTSFKIILHFEFLQIVYRMRQQCQLVVVEVKPIKESDAEN